jgi:TolB protein
VVTCLTAGNGFDDVHPTWSPNQTEIIFSSNRDGDFEIYRMNPDGTGVTQLTQNNAWDSEPHYYVFGQKIVFTSDRSGNKDIWQMDLTQPGYPVTQLTTDPGMDFNPAWVFDTGYWMWTSDRDGDLDIWRDGPGGMSQQTNNPENEDDAVYVAPNLYFSSDKGGTWDVIRRPWALPDEFFFQSPAKDFAPEVSPMGVWIAFVTNKDGNNEIYRKHLVTGELVRLTNNTLSDSRPAWYTSWF